MDQRALGELAERVAALIEEKGAAGAGAEVSALVQQAARDHHYAPWAMTSMIAAEADRLGLLRVNRGTFLRA